MNKKLFSLSIFTIALAVAFVFWAPNSARAGHAKNVLGNNQNTQAPYVPAAKAPGPYKYNYNQSHGITNDFGQDKTGSPDTF